MRSSTSFHLYLNVRKCGTHPGNLSLPASPPLTHSLQGGQETPHPVDTMCPGQTMSHVLAQIFTLFFPSFPSKFHPPMWKYMRKILLMSEYTGPSHCQFQWEWIDKWVVHSKHTVVDFFLHYWPVLNFLKPQSLLTLHRNITWHMLFPLTRLPRLSLLHASAWLPPAFSASSGCCSSNNPSLANPISSPISHNSPSLTEFGKSLRGVPKPYSAYDLHRSSDTVLCA